ncbi:MAG: ABC transporter permease [Immundisolibacterales bacterium]|nr:ABC transporter permease [Immundisolibacterales bacterium]
MSTPPLHIGAGDPSAPPAYRGGAFLACQQFMRNHAALAGFFILLLLGFAAVLAPWISPYDPTALKLSEKLLPPSFSHWMGTDYFGRDVMTRIVWGGRVSLSVAFLVVFYSLLVGVPIGLVSGFVGGRLDNALMRMMDAFLTFPPLLLAVAIVGLLGPDLENVVIALGIVQIPVFARIVRGSTLSAREEVYIVAARALGASAARVVFSGILRNIVSPIVVQITIVFAGAIIAEASLSFLGLGSQPPDPSWGRDLSEARRYMGDAPWLIIGPILACMLCVLSINFVGDGLRDSLDPRSWRAKTTGGSTPRVPEQVTP